MFSIGAAVSFGWDKIRENLGISLLTTLFVMALSAVGQISGDNRGLSAFIVTVIIVVISIIVRIGYTKIYLRMSDGEKVKFKDLFSEYDLFWKFIGVSILTGLAIIGGVILLIIPGLIFAVRFSFATYILVDTKTGPIAAMKESYAITKGNFWKLVGFWLTVAGVNVLGIIALGVGLLITIPLSTFSMVYVYRELTKAKAGVLESEPLPQQPANLA